MRLPFARAAATADQVGVPAPYVQAIPLYLRSDRAASTYFRDNREEIDAITGTALVIMMPDEVVAENVGGVADLFTPGLKAERYPGLMRSDLPCLWLEVSGGGSAVIRLPNDPDGVKDRLRALTDAVSHASTAQSMKAWLDGRMELGASDLSPGLRLLSRELPMEKSTERLVALICGVVFVTAILALAVFIPNPSLFQYNVFRIVLSLAAAGFVSMTPGFIELTVSNWVRAGGALAVFVIVYFYNPAALIAQTPPGVG